MLTDTIQKPGDGQVSIQHCLDLIQCQNVISGHPEAAQIPKSGEGLRPLKPPVVYVLFNGALFAQFMMSKAGLKQVLLIIMTPKGVIRG